METSELAHAGGSPLKFLDPSRVGEASRRETRNREVHLPPISVYRWWARRTSIVNDEILQAVERSIGKNRLLVADPFAGGGVIPLAALARGHRVYAQDVNPWAIAGLRTMLQLPSAQDLLRGFRGLESETRALVTRAYKVSDVAGRSAELAHTFRVAVSGCTSCGYEQRLYPYAMVTLCTRKEQKRPEAFLACPRGHLFRSFYNRGARKCTECGISVDPAATYLAARLATCPSCGATDKLETRAAKRAWRWETVLLEVVLGGKRREFVLPGGPELRQCDGSQWNPRLNLGAIPEGKETAVLRRHGFRNWTDLYPRRQRVVMEKLLAACEDLDADDGTRAALRIAIVGVAEMAGFASRWDRWYLKSYETMARHRFNFTTFTVEPNVWGCRTAGRGTLLRRVRMLQKASDWMRRHIPGTVRMEGRIAASSRRTRPRNNVDVRVVEGSSERIVLPRNIVDVVLTDPPYHDDVQYDELSGPLRAWAGLGNGRVANEAVASRELESDTEFDSYAKKLTVIFRECRRVLQPDGHLIFSYANREPRAWVALFDALQKAGFRANGYAVVHAENETHYAKTLLRSCNRDAILNLVTREQSDSSPWRPPSQDDDLDDEEQYLAQIGEVFLRVGELHGGWKEGLVEQLKGTRFLARALSS